jgi:hypothetical protein
MVNPALQIVVIDEEQAAKKLPQTLSSFFSNFDSSDSVQVAAKQECCGSHKQPCVGT